MGIMEGQGGNLLKVRKPTAMTQTFKEKKMDSTRGAASILDLTKTEAPLCISGMDREVCWFEVGESMDP